MADIVINPSVGKIDFFTNKGDQNPVNTARLTGNTILFTGPLSASSISTGGGGSFVTSVQPTANYLSKFTGNSTIANSLVFDNGTNVGIGTATPLSKLQINTTTAGSTVLRADGTSGTLFSVVDDLTDSLMSVNNSAGLPVLEVFADDRVIAGQYGANDFIITNNRVGIGTSNPLAELHVTSSTSLPSAAFLGGNVGVGTTSPIYPLDIPAASALTRVGSALIGSWPTTTSLGMFGNSALDQTNAANYALLQSNQGITYLNAASGQSLRLRIANTDRLIIDSGGNVGIGTTSFVYGSANRGLVELYGSSESLIALRNSTGNLYIQKASSDVYIVNTNSGIMSFATSNAQRMVILAAGSVSFNSASDILGQPANIYLNGNTGAGNGPALAFGQSDSVTGTIGHRARITGGGTSQDIFIQSQGSSNSIGLNANPSGAVIYFQTQGAERVRIASDGNVGIGTTSPSRKLDISGSAIRSFSAGGGGEPGFIVDYPSSNGYGAFFIHVNGTRRWRIGSVGDTNVQPALNFWQEGTGSRMIINNQGNVGIGTTSTAAKLHVVGKGLIVQGITGTPRWDNNSFEIQSTGGNGVALEFHRAGNTSATIASMAGELSFYTDSGTERMRISATSGNVGIGTTSPKQKLDIAGAGAGSIGLTNTGTTGYSEVIFYEGSSVKADIWVNGSTQTNYAGANSFNIYQNSNAPIAFYTNGNNERMRIAADGNVGIGTSTSVPSPLTVYNNADVWHFRLGSATGELRFGGQTSSGAVIQSYTPGGVVRDLYIQRDGGNIGVGTNAATARLHLVAPGNDGAPVLRIVASGSDTFNWASSTMYANLTADETAIHLIGKAQSQYNSAYLGFRHVADGSSSNMLSLGLYSADYLVNILGNGSVGIGTISPNSKLDIRNGNLELSDSAFSNIPEIRFTGNSSGRYVFAGIKADEDGQFNGHLEFWTTPVSANSTAANAAFTERMRITSAGNVGIGTTSPAYKLHVVGDGYVTGNLTVGLTSNWSNVNFIRNGGSTVGGFGWRSDGYFYVAGHPDYGPSAGNDVRVRGFGANLILGTNSTDYVFLNNSGNVGIGINSPATKLDVRGVIQGQSYPVVDTSGTGQWVKLGTLTIPQNGYTAHIRAYIHAGFNALNTQDYYVDIFFKTSNASSVDANGFAGNSWYYTTGYTTSDPAPKWVGNAAGVSATAYDLFLSLPAFTNRSHYIVEIVEGVTWTNLGTLGQTNPGNGSSTVCVSSLGFVLPIGNVGIGTTSLSTKLNVYDASSGSADEVFIGTTGSDQIVGGRSGGSFGISTKSASNGNLILTANAGMFLRTGGNNDRVLINSDGNVGIGTTSVTAPLHIYRASNPWIRLNGGGSFGYIRFDDGTSNGYLFKNTSSDTTNGALAGAMYTYTDNNKAFQHIHAGTALFTILSGGNVGIGTNAPAYPLDTRGNIGTEPYAVAFFRNTNASTSFGGIIVNGDNQAHIRFLTGASTWGAAGAKQWQIRTGQASNVDALSIYSWTTGTDVLYINNSGNVGIGTTSPSNKLEVGNFLDAVTNKIIVSARYEYQPEFNFRLGQSGTNLDWIGGVISCGDDGNYNGVINFKTANNGRDTPTTKMVIKANGNIGIGTTSPTQKLDIVGSYAAAGDSSGILKIRGGATGGDTQLNFGVSADNGYGWIQATDVGLTNNINIILNPIGGNVGIGTTSPSAKLSTGATSGMKLLVYDNPSTGVYTGLGQDLAAGNSTDLFAHSLSNLGFITFGRIGTNGSTYTEWARFNPSGNLGIGVTSPSALLNVRASVPTTTGTVPTGTNVLIDSNTSNYLTFRNTGDNGTYAGLIFLDNNIGGYIAFRNYTGDGVLAGSDCMIYGSFQDHIFQNGYVNENLYNRTETMRIKANGNVGIGTNSPTARLHILGSGGSTDYVYQQWSYTANVGVYDLILKQTVTSNVVRYNFSMNNASTAYNDVLVFDRGCIGIGTSLPVYKLDVHGTIALSSRPFAYSSGFYTGIYEPAGNVAIYLGNASDPGNYYDNTSHTFRSRGGVTNYLFINSSGNVGIGTTSPVDKLSIVNGNISLSDSYKLYNGSAADSAGLFFSSNQVNISGFSGIIFRSSATNIPGQTERMRITNGGNIGIGTTTPTALLHTSTTTAGSTVIRADGTSGTLFSVVDDLTDSLMSVNNSAGLPVFEVFADDRIVGGQYGANDFVITNNRVGIGTSNPLAELHVTGSASIPAAVFLGDVGIGTTAPTSQANYRFLQVNGPTSAVIEATVGGTRIGGFDSTSNILYVGSIGSFPVVFRTAVDEKMRITANGNIGIGTSSPNGRLTIVGDGSQNGYSGVLRVSDTAGPKWGAIGLPDTQTGTTAANNYYLIGRAGAYTDRVLSIHIPNAADYGSGVQPKFGVYSTGSDLLASVEASTGTSYFKGNVGIGTAGPTQKLDVFGGMAATIYYDRDNGAYYVDPAGTSNLVGLTVANTISGNISGTAGGENLTTISGRLNITSTQLIVSTAAGQAMYVGRQIGAGYSFGSAGIFTALSDNPNGGSNIFFQGYVGSTSNTPGGTLTYSIRADGQIYTTSNSATGVANNSFNVGRTILGALHIANGSGTSGNNNQAAITFQGDSNTQAQAGIYVSNNSSTGTAMGFATTDDYGAGPKLFMTATNAGVVNFPRSRPTYAGNTIIDTAYSGTVSGLNIGGTAVNLSTTRTNWSTNGTITAVVGQLCWKNYGNGHTIIDASNSTSPAGGSINNTNPDVAWTGTYPTLMGWNGANTYGVRVDSSRYADLVAYAPNRTDSTAYPVLWGAGTSYTNAYSCAAVTIQSSTGTLSATALSATNATVSGKLVQNSTTQSITGTGQTLTLNVAAASVHVVSMASGATITTISYTNRDNNPSVNTIMLVVKYAGTASITFTNVIWANGVAPTLTGTNAFADVFMLTSYQGGAGTPVWIGTVVAQALVSTNL